MSQPNEKWQTHHSEAHMIFHRMTVLRVRIARHIVDSECRESRSLVSKDLSHAHSIEAIENMR